MSIAVRRWSKEDLDKVRAGDRWLATILANASTYSADELQALHSVKVKRYETMFDGDDEPRILKATDDEMMLKFIDEEFTSRPIELWEVVSSYRQVEM